ncbi:Uma2 family endonuclease [Sorangium sp. So ce1151]|uniref:Uma2 family endonuclease n=1 Tax=Sorangium sp. So ce1151 TaxID=3133332 RepID=UPI003F5D900B
MTNPTLIVEALSRSTEEYDRGDKLDHYKNLTSLRQYVLVSHRERSVEVWTRGVDGVFTSSVAREGDVALHLPGRGKGARSSRGRSSAEADPDRQCAALGVAARARRA